MRQVRRPPEWREYLVLGILFSGLALIAGRVVHLQIVDKTHLHAQGDARHLREVTVQPLRGKILDRNGQILAMSTPVDSLWAEPDVFCGAREHWETLVDLLGLQTVNLEASCERQMKGDFMYIKRRLPPVVVEAVGSLGIPGVSRQREYRRYYPGGPVGAHLLGFTDIDDRGQEGLERQFDDRLTGIPGLQRALKGVSGNFVEPLESIHRVRHGENLQVSIDQRVQSLATIYLEQAVLEHEAAGGSVIVLSVPSGEILAMVTSPHFNPNDRETIRSGVFRNRAVTDVVEPGSTAKPFTIAMALESGEVVPETLVETGPGYYSIGRKTIRDYRDYGTISVSEVLVRSSNVGTVKIAMEFPFERLFGTLGAVGFNEPAADLPGEIRGVLVSREREIEQATISYGYGFSVTPLQLARAYTVFATDGELLPLTLEPKPDGYEATGVRVFKTETVEMVRDMMAKVATPEGTARRARVERYRMGGKTGTTHKLVDGKYHKDRYVSLFAGMGPMTRPRFITVVSVDDPRGGEYFGGAVAAPVFSRLMEDLMRLYNIPPDDLPETEITTIGQGGNSA